MPARPARPAPRRGGTGQRPATPQRTLSSAERGRMEVLKERRSGIITPFIFGLIAAILVAVILTFLCQNGLKWYDRCNCSWEKVILYSILSFVASVIQLFPYLSYREQVRQYSMARTAVARRPFEKKKGFLLFGVTIIIAVIAVLVFFMVVPLLQDQNGNFLWFFTRGGGILSVLAALLMSAGAGLFPKLFLTQHTA